MPTPSTSTLVVLALGVLVINISFLSVNFFIGLIIGTVHKGEPGTLGELGPHNNQLKKIQDFLLFKKNLQHKIIHTFMDFDELLIILANLAGKPKFY